MKSWGVRRGGATTSVAVSKRAGPGFALGSALFAFLLFAGLARGQSEPVFDVPVAGIEVRGNETAEKDLIVSTLNVPIGEPLNEQRLRAGVRALWNLGLFSSITVLAEPEAEAQKLIVDVVENRRVAAVEFAGNDKIGTEDLKGKVTLQPGQMLSDQKLFEGCRAIEKAYQDEGYASARCTSQVTPIEGNQVHVAFKIEEGPRVKIARVEIEGNQAFDDDKLRGEIKLKPNGLFHRKRYTAERLREERARLEEFYRNHGYRDAVVTVDDPQFEDVGKKVVLRFAVEEGQFYRFGDLTWSGNQAVTTTALQGIARFQPGDAFSQQALEQTTGEAYGLYTDKGFLLEVSIVPETTVENGRVNVAYRIEEGRPSHVQEIRIRGNRHTKEKVIRRELTLYPGDLLRRSALLRSQRDVFALGFFDDVQIDYEPTGDSTDVDIVYQVKEKTSGQLSGGMGYSSESGLTGFLQIGHPNLFGNGQSISLYLERGGRRENYELSFQDPWFLGHPVSVGIDVFNTRRTRDLYTETRRGGGLSFGRPWFYPFPDYTRIFVGYSLEDFKYGEFDASLESTTSDTGVPLADLLRDSSGLISSSYVSIVRNSTDNPFYPTLGSKTTARLELAGGPLGGDQHYFKPTIDHRDYFQPVWKPVLMLRWRGGWIVPLPGKGGVPSTETFRLGGTRPFEYLRGYDDYYIVPEENVTGTGSSAVRFPGGRAMFGFTAELQFPIVNPVRGLFFFDAGDTWNRPGEVGLSRLKESFGAGLRFEIPLLGPVGFDYAYGTAVKDWRFHFIVGPSF